MHSPLPGGNPPTERPCIACGRPSGTIGDATVCTDCRRNAFDGVADHYAGVARSQLRQRLQNLINATYMRDAEDERQARIARTA